MVTRKKSISRFSAQMGVFPKSIPELRVHNHLFHFTKENILLQEDKAQEPSLTIKLA